MPTHTVAGENATVVVDPERGGKVVSLIGGDGREWLAQAIHPDRAPYRGDIDFTGSDPAGWDECAPSIDACSVGGRTIPDHGDLWTAPWSVALDSGNALELSVEGRSLGYRLTRRISATSEGLRFDYSAIAVGGPIPFLWSAHPQFVSPPGSALELPRSALAVVDVLDPTQPVLPWSADLATLDTLPAGGSRKLYVDPETQVGSATLRHPDGAGLRMSWANCPFLGLWFDNRAYSQHPVIAIEPSLGYRDSLSWAVQHGYAPELGPDSPLEWSLEIAISGAT